MTVTVSILIGSESDLDLANKCSETLDSLSITNSIQVLSAHRTPGLLETHIRECESGGTKVFIAMAGLAAHLAGAVASKTVLPVIGVPGDGGEGGRAPSGQEDADAARGHLRPHLQRPRGPATEGPGHWRRAKCRRSPGIFGSFEVEMNYF